MFQILKDIANSVTGIFISNINDKKKELQNMTGRHKKVDIYTKILKCKDYPGSGLFVVDSYFYDKQIMIFYPRESSNIDGDSVIDIKRSFINTGKSKKIAKIMATIIMDKIN